MDKELEKKTTRPLHAFVHVNRVKLKNESRRKFYLRVHISYCIYGMCVCVCIRCTHTHTHTHSHTRCSSSSFIVTLSLILLTACARAQFSGCRSTTKDNETRQMAVCCQNLKQGTLSSLSALSVLFGVLVKAFFLFLNTPSLCVYTHTRGVFKKRTNALTSTPNSTESALRLLSVPCFRF